MNELSLMVTKDELMLLDSALDYAISFSCSAIEIEEMSVIQDKVQDMMYT